MEKLQCIKCITIYIKCITIYTYKAIINQKKVCSFITSNIASSFETLTKISSVFAFSVRAALFSLSPSTRIPWRTKRDVFETIVVPTQVEKKCAVPFLSCAVVNLSWYDSIIKYY